MGTPIPIPTRKVSKTIKSVKTHTGFELHIHFIMALFVSKFFLDEREDLAISSMVWMANNP
jgi:hypothetical protein